MTVLRIRAAGTVLVGVVLLVATGCGSADSLSTSPATATSPVTSAVVPTATTAAPAVDVGAALPSFETPSTPQGGDGYIAFLNGGADGSTVTVIDAATGGSVSGPTKVVDLDLSCGLAVVSPERGTPLVLAQRSVPTPSHGVERGGYTAQLVALDAKSLRELWTADIAMVADNGYNTDTYGSCLGDHLGLDMTFQPTLDGSAALVRYTPDTPTIVNLGTGTVTPARDAARVLGKWIVFAKGTAPRKIDLPARVELVDPVSGDVAGATDDVDLARELAKGTVAVAPSGATVVVDLYDVNGTRGDVGLASFTLPALQPGWKFESAKYSDSAVFLDNDGRAVGFFRDGPGLGHTEGPALSFATGEPAWTQQFSSVCAVTDSVVTVLANRQLAFLNAADGTQITYNEQITRCPKQLGDDLLVVDGHKNRLLRAAR